MSRATAIIPPATCLAAAALALATVGPRAMAEPAGDDPIGTASVEVWADDGDQVYGEATDVLVGTTQTNGAGRWDVDISGFSNHLLGVVAEIDVDTLRHPFVCDSEDLTPWSDLNPGSPETKCWGIGGDLFADDFYYINGVRAQALREDSGNLLYDPLDTRLAPDTFTRTIAPGAGDYRFYDIRDTFVQGYPIGIVLHARNSALGHDVLSGYLFEPSARQ